MNVDTSYTGTTAVAAVSGRVDSANAKSFEEDLSAVIDQGATGLVVDCGELNYNQQRRAAGLPDRHQEDQRRQAEAWPCAGSPNISRRCWRSAVSPA